MNSQAWIDYLNLEAHPEGGYFRQVEKSTDLLQEGHDKVRSRYTSIYFLLTHDNPSNFHRLTADEVWYYHAGASLTIHMISPEGHYSQVDLGLSTQDGQVLQYRVPKGYIFGSSVDQAESYALVSCMVAPGFEFDDFELFERQALLDLYPQHQAIIERLTRP